MLVSEQVKILLERMDLYPDEFFGLGNKWERVLAHGTFNYAEKFLIKRKYAKLKRRETQVSIMARILEEPQEPDSEYVMKASTVSRFSTRRMFTPEDVERMKSQWYADANNNRL